MYQECFFLIRLNKSLEETYKDLPCVVLPYNGRLRRSLTGPGARGGERLKKFFKISHENMNWGLYKEVFFMKTKDFFFWSPYLLFASVSRNMN